MNNSDEIVIADALGSQIRIHAARSTQLVEAARIAHDSAATCTAALGRTMTAAALIASDLKQPEEHVRVRISGNGPIGVIRVEADGAGNVRGCGDNMNVYAVREDGHLDVGKVVGTDGTLQVSRDMGLKEPFTGTVPLVSGEIGEDFARYFADSEQTGSVVSVGVLVNPDLSVAAAGGLIIQLMPYADDAVITAVEKVVAHMRSMTEYMSEGIEVDALIRQLFPDARILDRKPLRWHCDCSKEHFADALAGLRKSDLEEMIREDHGADAECRYCRKVYHFTEDELRQILENRQRVEDRRN